MDKNVKKHGDPIVKKHTLRKDKSEQNIVQDSAIFKMKKSEFFQVKTCIATRIQQKHTFMKKIRRIAKKHNLSPDLKKSTNERKEYYESDW
ncbi:MAG: hypothetical protein ACI4PQ_03725 [Butyricicoccaceae bacterium]